MSAPDSLFDCRALISDDGRGSTSSGLLIDQSGPLSTAYPYKNKFLYRVKQGLGT